MLGDDAPRDHKWQCRARRAHAALASDGTPCIEFADFAGAPRRNSTKQASCASLANENTLDVDRLLKAKGELLEIPALFGVRAS